MDEERIEKQEGVKPIFLIPTLEIGPSEEKK